MTTRSTRNKKVEEENVPFVKNIEMRANRGSKIKNLLDKKAQESDSDDFWKNNKYFGSFNDVMNESEDSQEYSQEADVPDVFDEDFGASSDSDEDEDDDEEEDLGKKATKGIQIFKKPEADVKKFIEKDDKKGKMKPAIAALKKTTARNKAKAEAEAKAKAKAKAEAEAEAKAKAKAEAEEAAAAAAAAEKEKAQTRRTPTPVKKAPTPVKRVLTPDTKTPKETPKASPAKIETTGRASSTRLAARAAEKAKVMEAEAKEPSPPKVETKTITFVVNPEKKNQKQIKVTLEAIIPPKTTKPKTTKAQAIKPPPSKITQTKLSFAAVPTKGSKGKTMEIEQQSSESESVSMSTRGGQEKRNAMAKPSPKVPTFKKPTKGSRVNPKQEVAPETVNKKKGKYIHDFYSQEELMKEAALTEIYNKKSLDSLLQIEADQKDSYLTVRRLEIDEPSVKYVSKKVKDQEERYLVISDNKAYQLYFGSMLTSSSTNLNKRPLPEETSEENQDLDEAGIVRKKLFITNAQYKLAEIKKNLHDMETEEEKIDKQLEVLKDLLQKKIKHLKS